MLLLRVDNAKNGNFSHIKKHFREDCSLQGILSTSSETKVTFHLPSNKSIVLNKFDSIEDVLIVTIAESCYDFCNIVFTGLIYWLLSKVVIVLSTDQFRLIAFMPNDIKEFYMDPTTRVKMLCSFFP